METGSFFGTCHAPRRFIRQVDGEYPVNGIATSSWASRQIRGRSLSAWMFAEPNHPLSTTAESVCVTSLPALISSLYWCA